MDVLVRYQKIFSFYQRNSSLLAVKIKDVESPNYHISPGSSEAGDSPVRTPFEIFVISCRGTKQNKENVVPAAKVYFFNSRNKKILKWQSHNEKAISVANNPPDELKMWPSSDVGQILFDFEEEACFLLDQKIMFSKKSFDQGNLTTISSYIQWTKSGKKIARDTYLFLGLTQDYHQFYEVYHIDSKVQLLKAAIIPIASGREQKPFDQIFIPKNSFYTEPFTLACQLSLVTYDPGKQLISKTTRHTCPLSFQTSVYLDPCYVLANQDNNWEVIIVGSLKKSESENFLDFNLISAIELGLDVLQDEEGER